MSTNQLEEKLQSIQTTKTILKRQKEMIERKIECLNQEEEETLQQLNIRLEDIILTGPLWKNQRMMNKWKYAKYVENQYSTKKDGHTAPMNATKYAGQENTIKQTHSTIT